MGIDEQAEEKYRDLLVSGYGEAKVREIEEQKMEFEKMIEKDPCLFVVFLFLMCWWEGGSTKDDDR